LATYLLRNEKAWSERRIRKAMKSRKEKWVMLAHPMPVFIVYFTAWVDVDGKLNLRDDIYGHDRRVEQQLFR
jgi:murein L,D-transpeptidase YcbB/YkuD